MKLGTISSRSKKKVKQSRQCSRQSLKGYLGRDFALSIQKQKVIYMNLNILEALKVRWSIKLSACRATAHWKRNICARGRDIKCRNPYLWRPALSPKDGSAASIITVHKLCSMSATHRDHCPSSVCRGGRGLEGEFKYSTIHRDNCTQRSGFKLVLKRLVSENWVRVNQQQIAHLLIWEIHLFAFFFFCQESEKEMLDTYLSIR